MDDTTEPAAVSESDRNAPAPSSRIVRPYVLTQGRTKSTGSKLALEASVRATRRVDEIDERAAPEARRIVELCAEARSIAEIAARLALPVGVVRVLVGDLAADGAVVVNAASPVDAATDVDLLERLLDGIRAL